MRELIIQPVLNGYIVRVGCQTIVFDSREKLIAAFVEYLNKPEEMTARYLKEAINKSPEPICPPSQACEAVELRR